MKTYKSASLALLAFAFLATPQVSAASIFGLEITAPVAKDRCMPATGNWVNAATQSCPDQGSGGIGVNPNGYGHVCEPKGKRG